MKMESAECKKKPEVLCFVCGLYTHKNLVYGYSTESVEKNIFKHLEVGLKKITLHQRKYAEIVTQC